MLKPYIKRPIRVSLTNTKVYIYICYVDRAGLGRCMLYTTDISMNNINTKKKPTENCK